MNFLLKTILLIVCSLGSAANYLHADVRLAGIFGDHMVLQRQKEIKIWGWADPGQNLTVAMDGAMANAQTDEDGNWSVTLPAKEAGGPFELTVRTKENKQPDVVIQDILIGEVWLCSGQSNMEWPVAKSDNADEEIAAANFPNIRQFNVGPHRASNTPIDDIRSTWNICTPENVGAFTAAGYFFGRHLHHELNVPIGLVHSSWGGTRIEPWTPPIGFAAVPALDSIYRKLQFGTVGTPEYNKAMGDYLAATETWLAAAKANFDHQKPLTAPPKFNSDLIPVKNNRQSPSHLYNGMLHGIVGFPIRGAIWYQGESNRADGPVYFEKKKALIQGWRSLWGQGDFPFYFVQIAPYGYGNANSNQLPRLWEAQSRTLEIPNTGMAVINDIGDLNNIHPTQKQEVGRRLALLALKNEYGQSDLIASGPTFESLEIEAGKLTVTMGNTADGMKSRNGKPLDWFEIAGEGTGFVKATVEISGNRLILSNPKVNQPTAMRFAWSKIAEPNLVNSANLPASSFRAGTVAQPAK